MKELPSRKSVRLEGYDYSSAGAYFITMCVKDGHELLGEVVVGAITNRPHIDTNHAFVDAKIKLSKYGRAVDIAIKNIPLHHRDVVVDQYVIMPNHVHIIVAINCGRLVIAPTQTKTSISTIVKGLKTAATRQIGFSLWQKSFYDHIIRNEEEYRRISQYIDENPMRWREDEYYTE